MRAGSIEVFAVALLLAALATPAVLAGVPLEDFAADPEFTQPAISPNGRYVTNPVRRKGISYVRIVDVDAPEGTKAGMISANDDVDWVDWANDDRILVGLSKLYEYTDSHEMFSRSRVAAMNRDGSKFLVLFGNNRRFRGNQHLANVTHKLPDDYEHILMPASDPTGRHNLYRVNVYDGKVTMTELGTMSSVGWMTDLNGVARVRWDYRERGERMEMHLRIGDTANWQMVYQYGVRDLPEINVVGFGDDPRFAIVASRANSDRFALYEYDVPTRAIRRALFEHPHVDVGDPVGGPIYDPDTTRLVGVYFVEDVVLSHYFEPDLATLQTQAAAKLPGAATVRLRSWSKDRSRAIVYSEGLQDPGSYHMFDKTSGKLALIGRKYPNIPVTELGGMKAYSYAARDGKRIPAYLTVPPGQSGKMLATVVMPHGGPKVRDYIAFDKLAHMLANRGYLVFQPNFRGSGGYGRAFAEAGHRQWGRLMQDDISDGVKALVRDGLADPNRICIVGGSYGGYAALAGGAFTPELYKCVVSFAGVSDLPAFLEWRGDKYGEDSSVYAYWVKRLGDAKADAEQMKAVSPALHADKFTAPVLLIHGEADDNVPIDQSEEMEKALRRAGKSVQFVEIPHEGHQFSRPGSLLKLMTEIERFVGTNIGR